MTYSTRRKSALTVPYFLLGAAMMLLGPTPVDAGDFRVETRVFMAKEKEPASTNLTLFRNGVVYDFAGGEITLFDRNGGRFVLLDSQRQLKTEVSSKELLAYAQWIRNQAESADDPLLQFCGTPHFEITPGKKERSWNFSGKLLTYQVEGEQAPAAGDAAAYRVFCDWFARLNSMTNPGGLPPFARMTVNAHLDQNETVPRVVHLTVAPHRRFGGRELVVRSEHDFQWGLKDTDLSRVDQAQRDLVKYRTVTLQEYRENQRSAR